MINPVFHIRFFCGHPNKTTRQRQQRLELSLEVFEQIEEAQKWWENASAVLCLGDDEHTSSPISLTAEVTDDEGYESMTGLVVSVTETRIAADDGEYVNDHVSSRDYSSAEQDDSSSDHRKVFRKHTAKTGLLNSTL